MPVAPKQKIILGKSFYLGAVALLVLGLWEGYESMRMGSTPESVTAEESASVLQARSGKHWVRISGLQVDCKNPVQEIESGKVGRTFHMASDAGKRELFVLSDARPCDESPSHVYEGTLDTAPSYVLKLLGNAGVSMASEEKVLYFAVGDDPSAAKSLAFIFGALGVLVPCGTYWSRRNAGQP